MDELTPEGSSRLQRCMNDLISILLLPAIWSGEDPSSIFQTLIIALMDMLHLDFIYAYVPGSPSDAPIEMVRVSPQKSDQEAQTLRHLLHRWLEEEPADWPQSIKSPSGGPDIAILPRRLGIGGELGVIVAGASRVDFPEKTENLILSVAANQATMGLQGARRLGGAEDALSASQRELKLIINSVPAMAWSASPDGSGEFFNKYFIDYVGVPLQQLQSLGWRDIVHPDDQRVLWQTRESTLALGKAGEAEARLLRADGEYRWFLLRWNPVHDEDGIVIRWYGINTDIEDRKRAELELAGEKHLLEMMALGRPLREVLTELCRLFEEFAPDCLCGIYPIEDHSKTFLYGIAPSLPDSYTDPVVGMSVDSDESPRGQSISGKVTVIVEDIGSDLRWTKTSCRAHVLEHGLRAVWSTPICSWEGTVIGTICVYRQKPGNPSPHHQNLIAHFGDLASIAIERWQAEEALRLSEFYLTEGQRISSTGTFSWRVDTDALSFSRELYRIFELEPNIELNFDLLGGRIYRDDLPQLAENLARVRAGFDNPDYEIRLQMPDGRMKWIRVFASVKRYADGRLECLGAVQDVTQRRLAEEMRDNIRLELAQVSRVVSLGALTASIAHEINQPLASIITNGETGLRWLTRSEPDIEKALMLTKRVVDDARRAAEIIDRIRTMASRGATKRSAVTLAEIVNELMAFLNHEFQTKSVSVSIDMEADLPTVAGDRTQLQQVFVNLAMNAIQALTMSSAAKKAIAIRAHRNDLGTISCVVEDNGPGIDPEHLAHLFDSLFTTKETGMGMGLSIIRLIIEAHNGHIRADNEFHPRWREVYLSVAD